MTKKNYIDYERPLYKSPFEHDIYGYRELEKWFSKYRDPIFLIGLRGTGIPEAVSRFCEKHGDELNILHRRLKDGADITVITDITDKRLAIDYDLIIIEEITAADDFLAVYRTLEKSCDEYGCKLILTCEHPHLIYDEFHNYMGINHIWFASFYADFCKYWDKNFDAFMTGSRTGINFYGDYKKYLAEDIYKALKRDPNNDIRKRITEEDVNYALDYIVKLIATKAPEREKLFLAVDGDAYVDGTYYNGSVDIEIFREISNSLIHVFAQKAFPYMDKERNKDSGIVRAYELLLVPMLFSEYEDCNDPKIKRNIFEQTVAAQLFLQYGKENTIELRKSEKYDSDFMLVDENNDRVLLVNAELSPDIRPHRDVAQHIGCRCACITVVPGKTENMPEYCFDAYTFLSDTPGVFDKALPLPMAEEMWVKAKKENENKEDDINNNYNNDDDFEDFDISLEDLY